MRWNPRFIMTAVLAAAALLPAHALAVQDSIPAAAAERLRHRAGAWRITMELMDENGATVRTVEGVDTASFMEGGRVLEIVTRFPDLGDYSRSWMFWDPVTGEFMNTAVDAAGNFWVLRGGLAAFDLASEARPLAGGGAIRVRFEHRDIASDAFTAYGEYSVDGGTNWYPLSRQRFARSAGGGDNGRMST